MFDYYDNMQGTSLNNISVQFGSVRFSSVRFGSALLRSALHCSVQFCSALLCSAQLSSAQHSSVQFCSALLCSVLFCFVSFINNIVFTSRATIANICPVLANCFHAASVLRDSVLLPYLIGVDNSLHLLFYQWHSSEYEIKETWYGHDLWDSVG